MCTMAWLWWSSAPQVASGHGVKPEAAAASVHRPASDSPSARGEVPEPRHERGDLPAQVSVELCGVGVMPIHVPAPGTAPESFELLPRPLGRDARVEAWEQVLRVLDASAADRDRAAALVLRASGLLDAEAALATLGRSIDTSAHIRQLALLGRQTRDAGVLQWALSVCERLPAAAECQAVSAHDLVHLAPEDGRHWLQLAAVDAEQRNEALRRAAQAPLMGVMPALTSAVRSAAPAGLPPYLLQELLVQAIGVQAALVDRAPYWALGYCRMASGEPRAACAALANTLEQRGPDLLSLGVSRIIGARVGWPAARVAAAEAEERRLRGQEPPLETEQPWSCRAVEAFSDWLDERDTLGERAALQRRAAKAAPR